VSLHSCGAVPEVQLGGTFARIIQIHQRKQAPIPHHADRARRARAEMLVGLALGSAAERHND
jgi:hypothetical protein